MAPPPRSAPHPIWWLTLAVLAVLIVFPQIEISLSAQFFDPARRIFPFRIDPFGEFIRKILPIGLFAVALAVAVLGGVAMVRHRPALGINPRVALYLLATLALGPGLLVNTVFKDHWGRPRPSTLSDFTGPNSYVRPFVPSDQCDDNCSFPSGHAALGFWTVAFALLAPPARRRLAMTAALLFGGGIGLARIAQGGHFLSDILVSGLLVSALSLALHHWLITRRGLLPWKNNAPPPEKAS